MMAVKVVAVEDRDLGLNDIIKEVKKLDGASTNIGIYGNGGDASDNLAERAAVHEFGTRDGRIPERPFNRQAFDKNLKDTKKTIEIEFAKVLARKSKAKRFLSTVGAFYEGRLKKELEIGGFRALSPKTIAMKGSSRPLLDTGQMRGAIEHREEMK